MSFIVTHAKDTTYTTIKEVICTTKGDVIDFLNSQDYKVGESKCFVIKLVDDHFTDKEADNE